jgi:hypothetical protein
MLEMSSTTNIDSVALLFKTLTPKLQKRALVPAIKKGANLVKKQAQAYAPYDTGALMKGLSVVRAKSKRDTVKFLIVASKRFWALRLDGDGKAVKRVSPRVYIRFITRGFVDKAGNHHAPDPFLRDAVGSAFEATRRLVIDELVKNIRVIAAESKAGGRR